MWETGWQPKARPPEAEKEALGARTAGGGSPRLSITSPHISLTPEAEKGGAGGAVGQDSRGSPRLSGPPHPVSALLGSRHEGQEHCLCPPILWGLPSGKGLSPSAARV